MSESLPNLWHLFHLRESPFFQDTLQAEADARYPIELFVGRVKEAQRMLRHIGSSASTRQTIEGRPGVGKTTLIQYIKAQAALGKVFSHAEPVRAETGDTTTEFLVKLLSYVYETILGVGDKKIQNAEPMHIARQIVRTFRISSAPTVSPSLTVPVLLRDLWMLARDQLQARGILIHINNFENLDEHAQRNAGLILRDMRDLMLYEGYHYVLVGTTSAIRTAITPHPQLRSVFAMSDELPPLPISDVHSIMKARYKYLRDEHTSGRPIAPVEDSVIEALYTVFRGDLRGLLQALDTAASELIGYGDTAVSPMVLSDVFAVLRTRYRAEMSKVLPQHLSKYLLDVGQLSGKEFTQQELQNLWGISRSAISANVVQLHTGGFLVETRREGRTIYYELSGAAMLMFA